MNLDPKAVKVVNRKLFILTFLGFICLSQIVLCACTFPPRLYRMDVRQGNYISPEMTAKLHVGMSKQAVVEVMGTPTLESFFEQNAWHYYHYFKPGNGDPIVEKHIIIYFSKGKVSRIDGNLNCE